MNQHTRGKPDMLDAGKTVALAMFAARDLRRAVTIAAQAVERRTTIPILSTIRVTADEAGAAICGTDLDIEVTAYCSTVSAQGRIDFTIDPRLLSSLIRYAADEVKISLDGDLITIEADDVEAQVRSLCPPETDWPVMLSAVSEQIEVSEATLSRALRACITCISTQETRYYLNGVFFHAFDGKLRLVSTDGHRLSCYTTDTAWPFAKDRQGSIVPRKAAEILNGLIKKGGNNVVLVKASRDISNAEEPSLAPKAPSLRIEFSSFMDWKIVSKTIDGTFPDYTRVIPQAEPQITATLNHNALLRFGATSERARAIEINPVTKRMTYSCPDGPKISMPVQATGNRSVGFNLGYLRDFARAAGSIRLEMTGPGDPARVLSDDPALLQVIMPMRV